MKHPIKLTLVLIAMFFISQLIGIAVIHEYKPLVSVSNQTNQSTYNLPYGMNPPQDTNPGSSLISVIIAIAIGVVLILTLMKIRAELFIRLWFFLVITFALGITINAFIQNIPYASLIALIIALPLAILKVFKRNILFHNLTELLIYPGIAAIIVPLLSIPTAVILLILISIYDIYAVWHAGFMQKMAKYQMEQVKVFGGLFVPYLAKKDYKLIKKLKQLKDKSSLKKIKVNVAILGGGDIAWSMIFMGTVLMAFGALAGFIVVLGSTIALSILFYLSEKGRFYPAMPFITSGCFISLGIVYLLNYIKII